MVRVVGTVAPPPWVATGGRDPDNARLGLVERTIIGVNNVYFDIGTSLKDRFWADHNATDVINHALAENYRLHGVQPLRGEGYLPEAWMTPIRQAQIVVVPSRPRGLTLPGGDNPMFGSLTTPPNRGQWVIESGLHAANLRLTGIVPDAGKDTAVLLVNSNSPGPSGEVASLLATLVGWDRDRSAMMKAVRAVLTRCDGDLALALTVMPDLTRFLPHEAYPLPPQRLLDLIKQEQAQQAMIGVDMGAYLPATIRLAKHDETTNAKKGTPRG